MSKPDIVVTGGFGFIGSNLVAELNRRGIVPYVIDQWKDSDPKWRNLRGLRFTRIEESDLDNVGLFPNKPIIVALGASVDTREGMSETLWANNVETLLRLRPKASRFIYASSGATYGAEEKDFKERVAGLRAMNPYAATKLYVDERLYQENVYALRFFNVYGPREAHKGDMASLVTKGLLKQRPLYQPKRSAGISYYLQNDNVASRQDAAQEEHWSLFKHPSGETIKRDFVYVGDVVNVICHFIETERLHFGIYNVGTGEARSFEDLVKAVENLPVEYVPLPDSLKAQYQRHTCADILKLRNVAEYRAPFTSLEEGVAKTREWMKEEGLI